MDSLETYIENAIRNAPGRDIGQLKADIDSIISQSKNARETNMQLKHLASGEIASVLKDRVIVRSYRFKNAPEQVKYVYNGSHWEKVEHQQFLDYVKAACRRMGFGAVYYEDEKFMNAVCENTAFRLSKYIDTTKKRDGVWINLRNGTLEIRPTPSPSHRSAEGRSAFSAEKGRGVYSSNPANDTLTEGTPTEGNEHNNVTTPLPLWEGHGGGSFVSLREHRPEDFFLYTLPYDYDPEAKCPLWHKFLDEVIGDEATETLLGEFIGYCFTTNLKLEKMALFYGSGANGKSVTLDVITRLLGEQNVSEAMLNSVTSDPVARAQIEGKLVNISSESNACMNNAVLKKLISGEPTEVRILYEGTRLIRDIPKFITSFNTMPSLEQTVGMRRRMIIFPFNHTIPADKQDFTLSQKLYQELPGILNWVMEKLAGLLERVGQHSGESFTQSNQCNSAFVDYVRESNSAYSFFYECCEPDENARMVLKDLYQEYCNYARECGFQKVLLKKNFKKVLLENDVKTCSHSGYVYYGVKVKPMVE